MGPKKKTKNKRRRGGPGGAEGDVAEDIQRAQMMGQRREPDQHLEFLRLLAASAAAQPGF